MESNAIELEYQKLRDEIVSRIETRSQTILGVVTLAGILYAFGIENQNPAVVFMYPIISLFLAASWSQNDISIKLLGKYIRDEIEPQMPGIRWQAWRKANSKSTTVYGIRLTSLSAAGVFIITQAVALLIGLSRVQHFTFVDWLAGCMSAAFTILTMMLLREHSKRISAQEL